MLTRYIQKHGPAMFPRGKNASKLYSQSGLANHLAWGKALWEVCQIPFSPPKLGDSKNIPLHQSLVIVRLLFLKPQPHEKQV